MFYLRKDDDLKPRPKSKKAPIRRRGTINPKNCSNIKTENDIIIDAAVSKIENCVKNLPSSSQLQHNLAFIQISHHQQEEVTIGQKILSSRSSSLPRSFRPEINKWNKIASVVPVKVSTPLKSELASTQLSTIPPPLPTTLPPVFTSTFPPPPPPPPPPSTFLSPPPSMPPPSDPIQNDSNRTNMLYQIKNKNWNLKSVETSSEKIINNADKNVGNNVVTVKPPIARKPNTVKQGGGIQGAISQAIENRRFKVTDSDSEHEHDNSKEWEEDK